MKTLKNIILLVLFVQVGNNLWVVPSKVESLIRNFPEGTTLESVQRDQPWSIGMFNTCKTYILEHGESQCSDWDFNKVKDTLERSK